MTTLLDDGQSQIVRCDECRRLWPVVPERLEELGWRHDPETDRHICSICATTRSEIPQGVADR